MNIHKNENKLAMNNISFKDESSITCYVTSTKYG